MKEKYVSKDNNSGQFSWIQRTSDLESLQPPGVLNTKVSQGLLLQRLLLRLHDVRQASIARLSYQNKLKEHLSIGFRRMINHFLASHADDGSRLD